MKNNKYKILVLSDLKGSTQNTLKSAVSLAKMLKADLEFFHVKKPTDIVQQDNQLSAMRTIGKEHVNTEKKIQNLISSANEDYKIKINSSFTFGNIKSEIESYIEIIKPDIIVLGKKKSKAINLNGDNVIDHVLKKFNGAILIASDKNSLEPNKELSLGLLNGIEESFELDFAEDLMNYTNKPLKLFKILKRPFDSNKIEKNSEIKTVDFVFEQNDDSISKLSNYLVKNNINLFCLSRGVQKTKSRTNIVTSDVNDMMNKLSVSLLFSNSQPLTIN